MDCSDVNLATWTETTESPLHSDNSDGGPLERLGDLTISDPHREARDLPEVTETNFSNEAKMDDICGELLRHLSDSYDDFVCTEKVRRRFSCLTELDDAERFSEPAIVRITTTCSPWPCHMLADLCFKTQVLFARKCNLPCCEKYTHPHEWVRHRRFAISKKAYLALPELTSSEADAVLRWADLVSTSEWQEGNWNERGMLLVSDESTFHTKRVSWNVMEEHLATLSYSHKKPLVFLAARICMESYARNKALYTHSQHFLEFARICVDLLKTPYPEVQEGILASLMLYLRTLKIFYCDFSHQCVEYVSSGLLSVLLGLLEACAPTIQAIIINILTLMATHAPYINLMVNLGVVSILTRLANTPDLLLEKRVYASLEVMSRYSPARVRLIQEGVVALVVRHLHDTKPSAVQLSCLFTLNSLCHNRNVLVHMLAVSDHLVVQAAMKLLTDSARDASTRSSRARFEVSMLDHSQMWCTLPRQTLILVCKLCVDDTACQLMVRHGLLLRLKVIWYTSDTETDLILVLEALAIISRFPAPGEQICQEGFLSLFAEVIHNKRYQQLMLTIILHLGDIYLTDLLASGLLGEMITCFENKLFERELFPALLFLLASFGTNDKVQELILASEGKVFCLVVDIAFLTNDVSLLQSCVTVLSRIPVTAVPLHLLKQNTIQLVTYIDKILKTGPDGLVLYSLMQLQDYLHVDFLVKAFHDHHIPTVLASLCKPPYKPPVQFLAAQILDRFNVLRSRRPSLMDHEGGAHTALDNSDSSD